jgi:hypothetical protein
LQPGAFGDQLPPEFDPSGSTLEGLRVLQCIEWLRDRILDGSLGHENAEMVSKPKPCDSAPEIAYISLHRYFNAILELSSIF